MSLADGFVHVDGAAGSLVPYSVASAVGNTMRTALANRGGPFAASALAEELIHAGRSAIADLVGGVPSGVVLGPNMTSLTYTMSRALAKTWQLGDEIIVSRLDHDANIRPWVQAARAVGVTVRWAEVDIETCELPEWQYGELLNERTRLVAVTAASNAVGTRPDVSSIARRAHEVGALMYVDAVHAAPHIPLDLAEIGADFLAVSPYKFCGPHLGAVAADPQLLADLHPDKLAPSPDCVPERFETGTPPFELYAGLAATADYLADLVPGRGSRRQRIVASMTAAEAYENDLFSRLHYGAQSMTHVTTLGSAARRTPTLSLTVRGTHPREVNEFLAERGICAWDGDYYATELFNAMGVNAEGGAVRIGLLHYNTETEVDHVLEALASLA
ncbi:MAG: cysteine desulfurase-like protein [Actinomycetota bacterium]|nr:cysteine desulfurase-like protein [Actinomycetota bacterium]